jgi:phospholipid/cholesterol/gamma-HCH transport system ATP-binding protein
MDEPLIQLQNVSKQLGANKVLDGAHLSIYRGEITTIIGKSGVGKSVLLKHIIGLMEPDSGDVLFQGIPISHMKKTERKAMKHKVSYMFQGTALFDSMSVFENIALPLKERTRLPDSEIKKRVQDRMGQLDIKKIDDQYPSQLSGGMRKRVALARALVTDPEIVLFDEPTTGLDPIRKSAVHHLISDFQKKFGFTGVIVSHEIPDIFYISQRIAMINDGIIHFQGTSEEIQKTEDPVVQNFIRGLESRHDELTGMTPHPAGEQRFKEGIAWLSRRKLPFSIIVLRLENMDEINEIAGHATGLTVLKNFADQVQNRLRITDTCIRYGFNTIMLLLPNTDTEQARLVCSKLAQEMKGDEIIDEEPYADFYFSVSAGFAEADKSSHLEELLASAESTQNTFFEFSFN